MSEEKPKKAPQWDRGIRGVVNTLVVLIVGITALLAWDYYYVQGAPPLKYGGEAPVITEVIPWPTITPQPDVSVGLPTYNVAAAPEEPTLNRGFQIDTEIPERPRVDVITYTVELGDSIFSIADLFNLNAATILWGNFELLEDNPHLLKTGQDINILPVDGTYYQWHENDDLAHVAGVFKVDPSNIIEYPGNRFDLTETTVENSSIDPGTWLIVPEGWRPIKDWGPPAITRNNPASAAYYGAGHCGEIYEGAIGIGTFVWPTPSRQISGYTYDPSVHPAIDIGGAEGNAIFSTDNGVVVYAGWSDYGYGYLIVVDHGTGWQSAYAHLSAVGVSCGQSVYQGTRIGALGNTGNSSGAHLHFELTFNGVKVNPVNFAQ